MPFMTALHFFASKLNRPDRIPLPRIPPFESFSDLAWWESFIGLLQAKELSKAEMGHSFLFSGMSLEKAPARSRASPGKCSIKAFRQHRAPENPEAAFKRQPPDEHWQNKILHCQDSKWRRQETRTIVPRPTEPEKHALGDLSVQFMGESQWHAKV